MAAIILQIYTDDHLKPIKYWDIYFLETQAHTPIDKYTQICKTQKYKQDDSPNVLWSTICTILSKVVLVTLAFLCFQ